MTEVFTVLAIGGPAFALYLLAREYLQALKKVRPVIDALKAIEKFGHGDGHGRGYTCANMAKQALDDYRN